MGMETPDYQDNETPKEEGVTPLPPEHHLVCYITGQLRKDTPEEQVRQEWARKLVEEYGYPKEDLGLCTRQNLHRA